MYQTIQLSSRVYVQGDLVGLLADGRVVIRVGEREFRGRPILKSDRRAPSGPVPARVVAPADRQAGGR